MIHATTDITSKTNDEAALSAARAGFPGIDLPARAASLGGEAVGSGGSIMGVRIPFLGVDHLVSIPDGEVTRPDGGVVPVSHQILILHALIGSTADPPSGEWIAFSDIPDGLLYTAVYEKRTAARLARVLTDAEDSLRAVAGQLGGSPAPLGGDASVVVEPFVGVPVGIVWWRGDDEFSPAVTFLYDETITGRFPTEDVVVLTQCLVERIVAIVRETAP
jgi:hypothetical protein